jgi:hypothetical protein
MQTACNSLIVHAQVSLIVSAQVITCVKLRSAAGLPARLHGHVFVLKPCPHWYYRLLVFCAQQNV